MAEPEIIPQPKPKPKKKSSKEDLGSPVVNKKKEVTISLNDNLIKPSKENVFHQSKRSKSTRKKWLDEKLKSFSWLKHKKRFLFLERVYIETAYIKIY